MRYQTEAVGETTALVGYFATGETVTIAIYDLSDGSSVAIDSASCTEVAATGVFKWLTTGITTPDTTRTDYVYIMTDSGGLTYKDKFIVGGYPDSVADIETNIDKVDGIVDSILLDTDELQTDWANGGRLDLIIDELTTQGDTNEGKIDTIDTNVDSVLVDTETTLPATLAALPATVGVLLDAEIATVVSQTSFTLATGSDEDDAYFGQTIVLYDDTNSDFPSVRRIMSYTGSTKTVKIDSAGDFTLGTDDSVKIFVTASIAQILNKPT